MTDSEKIAIVGASAVVTALACAIVFGQARYLKMVNALLIEKDSTIDLQAERIRKLTDDIPLLVFSSN